MMAWDVRDVMFWANEARRRAWTRRVLAYNSALLPHQKREVVKDTLGELEREGLEIEFGHKAEATDLENRRLIEEARERRKTMGKAKRRPKTARKRSSKIRRLK